MVIMKNTIKNLFKLGAYTLATCSLLALTACQNNADEPQAQLLNQQQLVSVPLKAEVTLDESARSLVYTLGEGGRFQHSLRESKQRMWTIIRSADASKPTYSAELDWEVMAGNKLVLNTQVSLPTNVYTAIQQGDWYASCILSGQASASGQSFVYNASSRRLVATTPSGANRLDHSGAITAGTESSQMPSLYIMPWTKVSTATSETGNKVISFSGSRLQPMGTVLRLNIQTEPATYQMANNSEEVESVKNYFNSATWQPEKITLKGRYNGYYDFAATGLSAGVLPPFVYTESSREYICTVPSPATPVKFDSPSSDYGYFYFWSPENQIEVAGKLKHEYDINTSSENTSSKVVDFSITPYFVFTPGPRMSQLWKLAKRGSGWYSGSLYTNYRGTGYGGAIAHFGINTEFIIVPPYPGEIHNQETYNQWWHLFNSGVQSFNIQDEYLPRYINMKNGHTKKVTLKYSPNIHSIGRQNIYWDDNVNA